VKRQSLDDFEKNGKVENENKNMVEIKKKVYEYLQ
jgi:hypothetical protein